MNKNRKKYLPAAWLTAVLIILNPASLQAATPTCGTTLTSDTTFDSDLNCTDDFVPLVISGEEGSGITLDCAGFSVRTTGEGAGAIVVDNATGVTVKNCTIITHGLFALGIALQDSSDSEISNNTITTTGSSANGINLFGSSDSDVLSNNITTFGIGSEGINMSQSNNNLVDGNTMSVTGLYARGIQLQNVSLGNTLSNNTAMADLSVGVRLRSGSDNNTLSGNTLESSTSHALDIQSASNNQMIANTMISPVSFAAVRNLSIQNGGLSVDDAGNIFAIENNFGSQGGSGGAVNTLVQIDPATGDPISFVRVVSGGADLGFGFDSLEIMSDGRFLATRGGNSNSLYQIDPISGEATQLPALTLPPLEGSLNGLQSTGPNTLLATTNEGELLSIDLDTGTVILLGDENDTPWSDLAMEPVSGRLFTTTRWSSEDSGTSHLYEVNPADGQIIQFIGDTGEPYLSDIDFSPGGILYGNDGLFEIDTSTGLATYIGGFGPDPHEPLSQNNTLTDQTFSAPSASALFLQPINLPASMFLSLDAEAIQLGDNSIFVDSTLHPFLDRPATITFENLGGINRDLLVDREDDGSFIPCGPTRCTFVSFSGGTLVFDVAGFTTYSSADSDMQTLESVVLEALDEIKTLMLDPDVSDPAKTHLQSARNRLIKALDWLDLDNVPNALQAIGRAIDDLRNAETEGADVADLIDQLVEALRIAGDCERFGICE